MFSCTHPSLLINLSLVRSTQKSITASFLHVSLFMRPAHIISAAPSDSHLPLFTIQVKSDLMSLHHQFSLGSSFVFSISLTASVLATSLCPATFLTRLFLSLLVSTFTYFLLPITPFPLSIFYPTPSFFPDSPTRCCMHFITFGSSTLKKRRIYANGELKNEGTPPLQCAEDSDEVAHYNIFSLLWICRIIIKNDL